VGIKTTSINKRKNTCTLWWFLYNEPIETNKAKRQTK
jgi:hypothetical protein